MNSLISLAVYAVNIVFAPLLLIGAIRKMKAILQGRQGPPLWQSFLDITKLLHKGETVSATAYWSFNAAPVINISVLTAVALMTPWLGIRSPIAGDLFLFGYLLVLAKFATSLSALDSGSSFGAIGASRETAISLFSETAMIAALAAIALHSHSSSFSVMFASGHRSLYAAALSGLVATALWMASMADLSRMPFDDPTTHLELTMIHEAQVLENSGRNLAIVEFATALRTVVLIGITARVILLMLPPLSHIVQYLVTIVLLALGAATIAVCETTLVRLRWRRLPNLLSFAVSAAMVACLVAALRG
jgi:formate hydrogenlyase subunit 4